MLWQFLAGGIYAVINIALLVWIYYDAEAKGESGIVWAIVILIAGPLGFVAYMLFTGMGSDSLPPNLDDENDMIIRAKYTKIKQPQKNTSSAWTGKVDYPDAELDRLIDQGDLAGAGTYLTDMINIAREMRDIRALDNYAKYEKKIQHFKTVQAATSAQKA